MSSTPTDNAGELLLVGVVVRVHGLRGEVIVDIHTDSPDARFADRAVLVARRPGTPDGVLTVASARPHAGRLLVRFVEGGYRVLMQTLAYVIELVPFAVFGVVAQVVGKTGLASFTSGLTWSRNRSI